MPRLAKVEFGGLHAGFGLDDVDGGDGADGGALAVVLVQLRVISSDLCLNVMVVAEADEVPVQIDDVLDGGDDLVFEVEVRHLEVVAAPARWRGG